MSPWIIPIILIVTGVGLAAFVAYEQGSDPVEACVEWCHDNGMNEVAIVAKDVSEDRAVVTCLCGDDSVRLELAREDQRWVVQNVSTTA